MLARLSVDRGQSVKTFKNRWKQPSFDRNRQPDIMSCHPLDTLSLLLKCFCLWPGVPLPRSRHGLRKPARPSDGAGGARVSGGGQLHTHPGAGRAAAPPAGRQEPQGLPGPPARRSLRPRRPASGLVLWPTRENNFHRSIKICSVNLPQILFIFMKANYVLRILMAVSIPRLILHFPRHLRSGLFWYPQAEGIHYFDWRRASTK